MNSSSPHILNTSANLAGLCFVVFSMIQSSGSSAATVSDEITALGAFLFVLSCVLSFLSMKSKKPEKTELLEKWADVVFFGGLCVLLLIVILTVFGAIK